MQIFLYHRSFDKNCYLYAKETKTLYINCLTSVSCISVLHAPLALKLSDG